MSQSSTSNRLIAGNTMMLYIRMAFSVCVNLYASRVILQVLGVEDFGIYNIVAGVVAMMGFLNNTMAGCTSRFLAFEIERGDMYKLRMTFNSAVQLHVFIALFVLILGETLGLWFVKTQIDVPASRMMAAQVVYQFSLISTIISFLQVPYSAEVIAHERMNAYAYIEILNVLLKLAAIFLVTYIAFDKLILYSILLSCVSVAVILMYIRYCKRHFAESVLFPCVDKTVLLSMAKFAGWDLYGNGAVVVQQQGINVLINRFYGVALNAATGVATQASSAVSMFVSSFTMALRPPIIKKYASGDIKGVQRLLTVAIVLCMVLAEIVCLPLYLRIDYLMEVWLTDVPPHAITFCKWMLLTNAVSVLNTLFIAVIHATGRIKGLSLISGSMYMLTTILTYVVFRLRYAPDSAYIVTLFIAVLVLFTNIFIAKYLIRQLSLLKLGKELIAPLLSLAITIALSVVVNKSLPDGLGGFLGLLFVNLFIVTMVLYLIWAGPNYGWSIVKLFKNEV